MSLLNSNSTSTTSTILNAKYTALDALCDGGITIASDGAQYKKISEFSPTDATTNPSLVYAAVCSPGSEYGHLLNEAVEYAFSSVEPEEKSVIQRTELALDYLLVLVGAQISSLIPGRVSLSIDPRLFLPTTTSPFDESAYQHVLSRCLSLYRLASKVFSGGSSSPSDTGLKSPAVGRPRLLIKIPATSLGIHVAATLESVHQIPTNLTLIFGAVQAQACAQAGVSVISPFVGRVKDFYDSRGQTIPTKEDGSLDLARHPGIQLVRRIKELFRERMFESTETMAAGFRSLDEIVELGRLGKEYGPDLMTLPPDLLAGLKDREGMKSMLELGGSPAPSSVSLPSPIPPLESGSAPPIYFTTSGATPFSLAAFEADLAEEEIALDKVPDGLKKFSADTDKLEAAVREALHARFESEKMSQKKDSEYNSPSVGSPSSPGLRGKVTGDIQRGRSVKVN